VSPPRSEEYEENATKQTIISANRLEIGEMDSSGKPLKKKKVFPDKFKKHIIRLFRAHLNSQFDQMYHRKHYRWVPRSKLQAIKSFF